MVRYKAIIAYDGTNFSGFQRQPNGRTVQAELEALLTRMADGQPIMIHGSGRTAVSYTHLTLPTTERV